MMNDDIRFVLISRVSASAYRGDCDVKDALWIIGMLSDTTVSNDDVVKEIEGIKLGYPEFIEILTVS